MSSADTSPGPSDAPQGAELIERAVGILMELEFRSAEDALKILQQRCQKQGTSLEEVAANVVGAADQRRSDLHLPEGFADRVLGRAQDN